MRLWTASALVLFCVLCFEICQWTEARQSKRFSRASVLEENNAPHRAHPLLFLRTHRSDSIEARLAFPITAIVLPMLASTSLKQTMFLMETLSFFNRDSNLRFYIGVASEQDATHIFNTFHNLTFDDYSQAEFGSLNERYIEVVVLRIPNSQHGRNRLHALLAKAWSEVNDFILVLHGSCVVHGAWSLQDVTKGGNGYSMVAVSDQVHSLQNFEQHVANKFDHLHVQSRSEQKIKCTEGIVQALRLSV
jgi:hypothetical protein